MLCVCERETKKHNASRLVLSVPAPVTRTLDGLLDEGTGVLNATVSGSTTKGSMNRTNIIVVVVVVEEGFEVLDEGKVEVAGYLTSRPKYHF